jgi:hypothetical protein
MMEGIREARVTRDDSGAITHVRLVFGPHYFVELSLREGNSVDFILGATHHGFRADASEVSGELERVVYEVRESHPDLAVD